MIDVKQQISAVRRTVGTRVLEAGTARLLTISQAYDTDVDDLWNAVTDPDRISRWFLPISGDLTVGGRYQFQGQAGGTVERCERPTGFSATWEYGGQVSWIEVRLSDEGDGRSRLELEHVAHVDEDMWARFGPGAVGIGWDSALMGLALHVPSGDVVNDPETTAAWVASPDGKLFMTLSSEAWYEANVASGTDEATARGAADRSTAAYTGAEAPE
jgi:uncharacterized protein YndB with AHSA1/START domain